MITRLFVFDRSSKTVKGAGAEESVRYSASLAGRNKSCHVVVSIFTESYHG